MKRYIYTVIALSAAGAVISGILLVQHYFPEANLGVMSCTTGADNPCAAVSMSEYSTLLGLPIASYGILSYLIYIFTVLVADYASGRYIGRAIAILFPLSFISLMVDLILILILIVINKFCFLCFITYIINSLLMITMIIWYREYVLKQNVKPSSLYTDLFKAEDDQDKRAAFSSYILFMFFLSFAVFSTTHILKNRAGASYIKKSAIQSFINEYVSSAVEKIEFPDTGIYVGAKDPVLNIRVFSDFLCSACYRFYRSENYLLSRFRGKIKISYYNFPLDRSCNSSVENTIYKNSCLASASMIAADRFGIFHIYHDQHFENYLKYKNGYSIENSLENLDILNNRIGLSNVNEREFHMAMKSEETSGIIKRELKLAKDLKIEATPTIFINGRRLVGVPPKEMLEAAIIYEINRLK